MKYKKAFVSIVFIALAVSLYASSLTISSISFSDSLGNPVSKDYKVASYMITGKYMSSSSTINGQFSRAFDEIPTVIDNLSDGNSWNIKLYAYDTNGNLIGESDEKNVSIKASTEISPTIVVDVPTLVLNEPIIRTGRVYKNITEDYDVASYSLTLYSLAEDTTTTEAVTSFPYKTTSIASGRYLLSLAAIDNAGNTIASISNVRLSMVGKGSVEATLLLDKSDLKLSLTYNGILEDNGYIYLEDKDNFSVSANIAPLKKDSSVSYKWYISKDNTWKELKENGNTINYKDIKKNVDDDSFSILCVPTIDNVSYSGKIINISQVPELEPTLFITGANPAVLGKDTSFDISSTSETISFKLELPTYYLGKGISAYYTLDGTSPSDKSDKLTIGSSISINAGDKTTLRILLVAPDNNKKEFKATINSTKEAQTPSISVANRDFGRDLYATLSTRTEGANIYYTLDGTEPTTSSNLYTEPFKVKSFGDRSTATIKAIAVKDGYQASKPITLSI